MDLTRRRMLGFGGLAVLAACGKPGATAPLAPAALATPATPVVQPTVTPRTLETPALSELVYRSAIGDVQLVVMRPRESEGVLPVCLAFHGHGADARQFIELGVPSLLTATNRGGLPPFAVAAVDGRGWDAAAMGVVADELPAWLTAAGVAATPFAVMGISTGAVAAFAHASRPGPQLVAMVSPAVFSEWADAEEYGIADEAAWKATDPFRAVPNVPTAIWCGEDDPLAPTVRMLAGHTSAEAVFAPGAGRDPEYWKSVMPAVFRRIGEAIG